MAPAIDAVLSGSEFEWIMTNRDQLQLRIRQNAHQDADLGAAAMLVESAKRER
jgi:hypothetical protein